MKMLFHHKGVTIQGVSFSSLPIKKHKEVKEDCSRLDILKNPVTEYTR